LTFAAVVRVEANDGLQQYEGHCGPARTRDLRKRRAKVIRRMGYKSAKVV